MDAKYFNTLISLIQQLPHAKLLPIHKLSLPKKLHSPTISTKGLHDSKSAFSDYQSLFVSQRSETTKPVPLELTEGSIPPDFPSGTYYLTGPGLFSDDYGSTVHPLDGHGYLRGFDIDGAKGEVKYSAKYVKTEAKVEERDEESGKWRFTHRGPFSVLKGGKMFGNVKVMKNVANTSVLKWGGRLFCLWEGGVPYEIESRTLDTVGMFDLIDGGDGGEEGRKEWFSGGDVWDLAAELLKPILHGVFKMPPKRLLSHYKIDASRNRLLFISCNAEDMLLPRSNFTFYEFDSNFKLLQKKDFSIPDHLMIHDWAFTNSHYILFGNRIKLDIVGSLRAVCGLSPMISALSVNSNKPTSPIYLLPRFSIESNKERDWKIPIEAPFQMWVLHVANAFEEKVDNGNLEIQLHASGCSYHWFNFQTLFGYDWKSGKLNPSMMNVEGGEKLLPHLLQVSIILDTNGNCQKCCVNPLNQWNKATDFPTIHQNYSGIKHFYIYAATSMGARQELPHFPFDTVVKLNIANNSTFVWSVPPRRFIGEPIFIPKGKNEDDGYLIVVEYAVTTQRCYLVILDPERIGENNALLARLEVPIYLNFPLGFHGFWAPNSSKRCS